MTYQKPQLRDSDLIIQFIADYGYGTDNADREVHTRLRQFFGFEGVDILHNPIPKFNTVNNGFWIAQHALTAPLPHNTLIFHNVAPRQDDIHARKDNSGEKLLGVRLDNGVIIVGPNSGYSLALVRDHIELAFEIPVDKYLAAHKEVNEGRGTQFRSRDIFIEPTAEFHQAFKGIDFDIDQLDYSDPFIASLVQVDPTQVIPKLETPVILHIDNYGNVKTNITGHNLEAGDQILVNVNGYSAKAVVAGGAFVQETGTLGFVPGSSGWDKHFHEIFVRGQDASIEIVGRSITTGEKDLAPGDTIAITIDPLTLNTANGIDASTTNRGASTSVNDGVASQLATLSV